MYPFCSQGWVKVGIHRSQKIKKMIYKNYVEEKKN